MLGSGCDIEAAGMNGTLGRLATFCSGMLGGGLEESFPSPLVAGAFVEPLGSDTRYAELSALPVSGFSAEYESRKACRFIVPAGRPPSGSEGLAWRAASDWTAPEDVLRELRGSVGWADSW
jgi:hypothetical protein